MASQDETDTQELSKIEAVFDPATKVCTTKPSQLTLGEIRR